MIKGKSKVINIQNNVIGIVVVTAGDQAWVYELGGGDHIFKIDNLQELKTVVSRPTRVCNDAEHATLMINGRPVFMNLVTVVQEKLDAIQAFMS